METKTTKLKIISVGPVQTSNTVKTVTRKVVMLVSEVPCNNPFGNSIPESAPTFEVEVYNHNIETFNINTTLVGEIADCELVIKFYKKDANAPIAAKFLINDMNFRI